MARLRRAVPEVSRPEPPPPGQRRFFLRCGKVIVAGRFGKLDEVTERAATVEDLALLTPFGRRVVDTGGYWDVASFHWPAKRTLLQERADG